METAEYLQALKRRWPIVVLCALIAGAIAYVLTPAASDSVIVPVARNYQATHTLLVTSAPGGNATVGTVTFQQLPIFATTGVVPERAAERLGYGGPPAALAATVEVKIDAPTGAMSIAATSSDPDEAVARADAFADELVTFLAEQQDTVVQARLQAALAQLQELENQTRTIEAQLQQNPDDSVLRAERDALIRTYGTAFEQYQRLTGVSTELGLTTLERAQPVPLADEGGGISAPASRASRVPLGALAGAMLGFGIVVLIERLDGRIRNRKRAETAFQAPVIAELPSIPRSKRTSGLLVSKGSNSMIAEGYRTLRASVTFMAQASGAAGPNAGVVLVTSPTSGDGKTTTAANLAVAFAETGRKVVLVNADFRKPAIVKYMPGVQKPNISTVAEDVAAIKPEALLAPTAVPGLHLLDLSDVRATPGDLARLTARKIEVLRNVVDVVVIDTSPLSLTAEALEFVDIATVTILMARVGRTSVSSATRAGELVRFGDAEQVAVVLTDAGRFGRRRAGYYGYYGDRTIGQDAPAAPLAPPVAPAPERPSVPTPAP